jgi:23S rRNA (uracil1939-C5)-methyltransferase
LYKFGSTEFSWKGKNDNYGTISVDDYKYSVKSSSFFQVNRYQHSNMLKFVKDNLFKSKKIIDLYSGVGFFIPLLLKYSKEVIGVESFKESTELSKKSFPEAIIINNNVDKYQFEDSDIIIADPPRSGLSQYVMKNILKYKYNRFIYISCSSATFARDAKILTGNGYNLKRLSLLDLFPQTSHIEILSVFDRNDFNE